jgi:hypothetical protein
MDGSFFEVEAKTRIQAVLSKPRGLAKQAVGVFPERAKRKGIWPKKEEESNQSRC